MASIPFSGVTVQSILDHWTPSLDALPSMDSITPEVACGAVLIAANVALIYLTTIAILSCPAEPKEEILSKKAIVPYQGSTDYRIPSIPQCPQCHRSMEDFQVIVIDPFADINWMLGEIFDLSIL